jgi:nucleobase transporter 1/2
VNSDCFQEEKAKMIQTLLFVAGINTFFQTFFGTRLPAVIGGSFSYLPATISIVLAGRYSEILDPVEVTFGSLPYVDTALLNFVHVCFLIVQRSFVLQRFEKTMRGIQGALIVASTLQIVVGFSGLWRNVARFNKSWLID